MDKKDWAILLGIVGGFVVFIVTMLMINYSNHLKFVDRFGFDIPKGNLEIAILQSRVDENLDARRARISSAWSNLESAKVDLARAKNASLPAGDSTQKQLELYRLNVQKAERAVEKAKNSLSSAVAALKDNINYAEKMGFTISPAYTKALEMGK